MSGISWSKVFMSMLLTGAVALTGCGLLKPGKSQIEKESVSIVNEMLRNNNIENIFCHSVKIHEDLGGDRYKATAYGGSTIEVIIQVKGRLIEVGLNFEDQRTVMIFAQSIINRQLKGDGRCSHIGNDRKTGLDEYRATAFFDDGSSVDVRIKVSGSYVEVIPIQ